MTPSVGYVVVALVLGALVRAIPLIGLDFPAGDGGMFAVMASDLRQAGFALPAFTSYNGGTIPFAYPPLGLYLLAALPGDPIATERWLPLAWSVLGIGAFWLLALQLDEPSAGVATVAFALLPAAYGWEIMGGGVTRALGLLLALLALTLLARALRNRFWLTAAVAGIVAGLAGLSHPADAAMIVIGAMVIWGLVGRTWRGVGIVAVSGAVALVIGTPWLWIVLGQHGLEPFLSAAATHAGLPPRWIAVVVALLLGWVLARWAIPMAGRWRRPFVAGLLVVAIVGSIASGRSPGSVLYAVAPDVRQRIADLPSGAYSVYTGNPGDDHVVEWFPALSGAVSVGTYQGAEWRGDWEETVAIHVRVQQCRCAVGDSTLWSVMEAQARAGR